MPFFLMAFVVLLLVLLAGSTITVRIRCDDCPFRRRCNRHREDP